MSNHEMEQYRAKLEQKKMSGQRRLSLFKKQIQSSGNQKLAESKTNLLLKLQECKPLEVSKNSSHNEKHDIVVESAPELLGVKKVKSKAHQR